MTKLLRWLFFIPLLSLLPHASAQTGVVAFSLSNYSVNDNAGTVNITVIMSGSPAGNSIVDFSTTGAVVTNGTLTFATNVFIKTFPVKVPAGLTTNLLVNLVLQNPTGSAVLGSPTNAVLTIVATGGSTGSTGTHVFPVTLKAFLTTVSNTEDVVKLKFNNNALSPNDRMVLIVDEDEHTISLGSIDGDLVVTLIATSTHCAILPNGQFGANLALESVSLINASINMVGTGDAQVKGSFSFDSATGVAQLNNAILLGVFNDSVDGNTNDSDALVKGTFSAAGKEFNIEDVTLP
ncbi:MAG: hypothetical protein WCS70_14650 [Verrucomicrobiota bacterium]